MDSAHLNLPHIRAAQAGPLACAHGPAMKDDDSVCALISSSSRLLGTAASSGLREPSGALDTFRQQAATVRTRDTAMNWACTRTEMTGGGGQHAHKGGGGNTGTRVWWIPEGQRGATPAQAAGRQCRGRRSESVCELYRGCARCCGAHAPDQPHPRWP